MMAQSALFKALAHKTRLHILSCILASGDEGITVRAIEDRLCSITQAVVSHHLGTLRAAGLVTYTGETTGAGFEHKQHWHHYHATRPDELRALLRAADVLCREAAIAEKEYVK